MTGVAHRPGAYKQSNKGHNTGRHRSKGAVEKENRGRVGAKAVSGARKGKHRVLGKIDRRNKAVQLRQQAREEVLARKRQVGGVGHAPLVLCVVPLTTQLAETVSHVVERLTLSMEDCQTVKSNNVTHLAIPRFKQRMSIITPNVDSLQSVLDSCKVCDSVLFLVSPTEGSDDWGETLLSAVLAQGLSAEPIFLVENISDVPQNKIQEIKKLLARSLSKKISVEKVWSAQTENEAVNLIRHLGSQKRREVKQRDRRGYLLCEDVKFLENDKLAVTGYVRGSTMSADRLVHIPGLGDFQLDKILAAPEPLKLSVGRKDEEMFEARDLDIATEQRQELDVENIPDGMEGEQTWPTEEEIMAAENKTKKTKRVPKGFSEYQAAWIVEEEDEDGGDEDEESEGESDEDMEDNEDVAAEEEDEEEGSEGEEDDQGFETESVAMTEDFTDYDTKHVNFAAEVDELEAMKAARMEELFPDEVDTPIDVPARVRFQKYRGLKSFRTTYWDPKENLPLDYARIWQFENFDRTKKRVLAESVSGAEPGWYVTLIISGVGRHLQCDLGPGLVVTSLLPHEHRMSVVNVAVRRHPLSGSLPVKSKSRLVFQVGWRRFAACPIFSQHTNGSKHKYERYFRDGVVVMTTFAPITFPPAPVLVFTEQSHGQLSLLATGSLLNNDPNRIVVKRTVLSGNPFKVNKRVCTVRFMFFNRADIDWFKPVELRTKTGRRGHIKEALGTHGHMKCIFDGPVSQQDTVMMNLYKRIYPKWTYDGFVADTSRESQEDGMED